jgi:sterol desaturase/sphingolipid hydroxylase (fatty acid hydroxylase superfamily)
MPYLYVLFGTGLLIGLAERVWPRRREQAVLRKGFFGDLLLALVNVEILAAWVSIWVARFFVESGILKASGTILWVTEQPIWIQAVMLFIFKDLVQFWVHNLMHRVPWLWQFHRLHHSTEEMDWMSNWRFHGMELVFYQFALYLPCSLLGLSGKATLSCAVISTVLSHFSHANLNWKIGPLKYLINCPELHVWHHAHPETGAKNVNLGIGLSVWDWIIGTGYQKEQPPSRLGC